jgi:hypothetical protein
MIQLPRDASVTTAGWLDLVNELDRWAEAERVATLWWRDDDAVAPSSRLDRLVSLAGDIPVALAVIPAVVKPELAVWLSCSAQSVRAARLAVLQHGWRHANHSAGGKKSEFPAERSCEDMTSDLAAGRARLTALFGTRALPVLVPPWNRFDDCFLRLLGGCGLRAISRVKPRRTAWPARGLIQVNVHVDLVAWAGNRDFIGEGAALGNLVGHLRERRLGDVGADEPTGILTHHLLQDEATDAFLHRLVAVTSAHAAARWLDATEVFTPTVLVPA